MAAVLPKVLGKANPPKLEKKTNSSITVSWDPVAEAHGYILEVAEDAWTYYAWTRVQPDASFVAEAISETPELAVSGVVNIMALLEGPAGDASNGSGFKLPAYVCVPAYVHARCSARINHLTEASKYCCRVAPVQLSAPTPTITGEDSCAVAVDAVVVIGAFSLASPVFITNTVAEEYARLQSSVGPLTDERTSLRIERAQLASQLTAKREEAARYLQERNGLQDELVRIRAAHTMRMDEVGRLHAEVAAARDKAVAVERERANAVQKAATLELTVAALENKFGEVERHAASTAVSVKAASTGHPEASWRARAPELVMMAPGSVTDVVVLVADGDFQTVHRVFQHETEGAGSKRGIDTITLGGKPYAFFRAWAFDGGAAPLSVVVVCVGNSMGDMEFAMPLVVGSFKPVYLVSLGISIGLMDAKVGDVVVPNTVFYPVLHSPTTYTALDEVEQARIRSFIERPDGAYKAWCSAPAGAERQAAVRAFLGPDARVSTLPTMLERVIDGAAHMTTILFSSSAATEEGKDPIATDLESCIVLRAMATMEHRPRVLLLRAIACCEAIGGHEPASIGDRELDVLAPLMPLVNREDVINGSTAPGRALAIVNATMWLIAYASEGYLRASTE